MIMQKTVRPVWFGTICLAVLGLAIAAVALFGTPVKANPSGFTTAQTTTCSVITAETSPNYMTVGTATTTYTFDTGCASAGSMDGAAFLTNFSASSTAAVLGISFEYSQDASRWYSDDTGANASTSNITINTPRSYSWTYASTSQGGAGGSNATSTRILTVLTPTRYVRAVLTLTGANAAVWGEFVGKRQNP